MDASGDHCGGEVVRTADNVDHHLGFAWIGHGWFEDTHDGGGARAETFQANGLADNRGVFLINRAPKAIGEDCGAWCVGAVIAHVEQAAQDGVQAHHFEIIAAYDAGLDPARLAKTHHGKAKDGEVTELFDTLDAGAQIVDLGYGEGGVVCVQSRSALPDIDEAVFIAIDERAEKHPADQRKDCGVSADAERKREYHRDREALGVGERAQGCFQIIEEGHVFPPYETDIASYWPSLNTTL